MKRKFFSMMVTACAALLSVAGLTCCGGGGGGGSAEDIPGYLTLDGFAKQHHGIRLEATATYLYIKPVSEDSDSFSPDDSKTNVRYAFAEIYNQGGTVSTRALVRYEILSYSSEGNLNDENGKVPATALMTITLGQSSETEDRELLAAIGLNSTTSVEACLSSSLSMYLVFTGNGGTASFSTVGSTGGFLLDEVSTAVSVWGPFSVIK